MSNLQDAIAAIDGVCRRLGFMQDDAQVNGPGISASYRVDSIPKEDASREEVEDAEEEGKKALLKALRGVKTKGIYLSHGEKGWMEIWVTLP
jgi:hypothetical protein